MHQSQWQSKRCFPRTPPYRVNICKVKTASKEQDRRRHRRRRHRRRRHRRQGRKRRPKSHASRYEAISASSIQYMNSQLFCCVPPCQNSTELPKPASPCPQTAMKTKQTRCAPRPVQNISKRVPTHRSKPRISHLCPTQARKKQRLSPTFRTWCGHALKARTPTIPASPSPPLHASHPIQLGPGSGPTSRRYPPTETWSPAARSRRRIR
jgi:hypothetical protein